MECAWGCDVDVEQGCRRGVPGQVFDGGLLFSSMPINKSAIGQCRGNSNSESESRTGRFILLK